MPLQDILLPSENVKFHSKSSVRYGGKKYHVLITDKRIILFAQRGYLLRSEDIVSERLDRLRGLEYSEKGLMFRMAKISIQGTTRIDIHGPSSELKPMFRTMQSLINIDEKEQERQPAGPWQLTNMTKDLKQLFIRAVFINESRSESYTFSFTSILLAFLVSNDPISKWFQEYTEKKEIKIEEILDYRKISKDKLEEIRNRQTSLTK